MEIITTICATNPQYTPDMVVRAINSLPVVNVHEQIGIDKLIMQTLSVLAKEHTTTDISNA